MTNHKLSFNMIKMPPATKLLAEPSKTKPWPVGLRRMAVLVLAGVLTFVGPRREASADTPAVVVAAEIAFAGAVVGGVAAVTAAGVLGAANILAAAIKANGDNPPPNGDNPPPPLPLPSGGGVSSAGGGSVSSAGGDDMLRIGEAALPASVRSFIDRNVTLSASKKKLRNGERVAAKVNYAFEGDVRKADPKVGVFKLSDVITFRLDIANMKKAEDVRLEFRVAKLVLSTLDVPQTKGHSQLRFTARQDGREIWSFVTRVDQGTTPTLRSGPPELQTAKVRLEKDRLTIENLVLPISYTAPGAKASTQVEVDLEYEGEGARI